MLVLTRTRGESILIDDPSKPGLEVEIEVVSVCGGKVMLGITAPKALRITRPDKHPLAHAALASARR